jgi:hypothetical protein
MHLNSEISAHRSPSSQMHVLALEGQRRIIRPCLERRFHDREPTPTSTIARDPVRAAKPPQNTELLGRARQ